MSRVGRIVVDVGCFDREKYPSLPVLAGWYKPEIMYGFDPSPQLNIRTRRIKGCDVKLKREAAWIYDGTIAFSDHHVHAREGMIGVGPPPRGNVSLGRLGMIGEGELTAKCFDFSKWMEGIGPAVVKIDIEGAEYGLLEKMIKDGTHTLIQELLIEWHFWPDPKILRALKRAKVPVKEWLY